MNTSKTIKVTYFFRKPFRGYFSIEHLFSFIISALPSYVQSKSYYMKRMSKGLINRVMSCFEVISKQNQVNHITGDVHYISFLMKKKRTVLTIHDLEVLKRLSGLSRFIVKLFWFTLPAWRVKYITVISAFTREELLKMVNVKPGKVVVIHDCISPEVQASSFEFNTSQPNILHVGTAHNKNLERLIEATEGLNVTLTIIGHLRDHQKELLKQKKTNYRNLCDLTYDDVIEQYKQADMVSFVSLYEGFGLPILEAQTVGRPVITSTVTSMPEVAGDAALLVDPENVAQIRKAIVRLIEDGQLRNDLVQKGFSNITRFSPKAIAQKYADLYERMINEY